MENTLKTCCPSTTAPLFIPGVAERLGVSIDSVRGYISRGQLAAYKLGGVGPWRIDPEAVEAFLQASREEAAEVRQPVAYVPGNVAYRALKGAGVLSTPRYPRRRYPSA